MCPVGVRLNTSRVTDVMIGRIITDNTTPAVKMLPPPVSETLPSANRKIQFNVR